MGEFEALIKVIKSELDYPHWNGSRNAREGFEQVLNWIRKLSRGESICVGNSSVCVTSDVNFEVKAELTRIQEAFSKQDKEICQILGKALGYPWYKDDPKTFPGATENDGVFVGDNTPESLSIEIAEKLDELLNHSEKISQFKHNPKPFPWKCLGCGKDEVRTSVMEYVTKVRHNGVLCEVKVPKLPHYKCSSCGRILMNNESHKAILEALRRKTTEGSSVADAQDAADEYAAKCAGFLPWIDEKSE